MYRTIFALILICSYCTCTSLDNVEEPEILKLWKTFPLKIITNTTMLRDKCREAMRDLLIQADHLNIEALKVLDSTGKLPSGILNGNVNQYGDFDQCLSVKHTQYCLAEIDLEPLWKQHHNDIKNLVHSFYAFRDTNFSDPGHRVPGFKMIRWGICLPTQCSPSDLKSSLKNNFGIDAEIRPGMCQKIEDSRHQPLTTFEYFARGFFLVIILLILISTGIDYVFEDTVKNRDVAARLLMCFSLKSNLSDLFSVKAETNNEIAGLHGIRSLCAFALLMTHKSISLFFNPYINRTYIINAYSSAWTLLVKNAIIYTDGFLLLSGLLNANALLSDLESKGSMSFWGKLNKRLFRIFPSFVALILFCTYILPHLGSGPLWPTVIDHHSVLCKKHMWRNFLFIHNYFGFDNMCLTHTHQIGMDMQLFLATPFVIYAIWKFKKIGIIIALLISTWSTVLRYYVTYKNELSTVIYFGIPVTKMFETASLSYILPTHRATIYLIGVATAYILKYFKPKNFTSVIAKIALAVGWCLFFTFFFGSWFGPYKMALRNYVYDKNVAASIAALTPIFWGSSLSFIIFVINHKIAWLIGDVLTWKYFQIGTKLSYALYLVQFPIFFFNVGRTRHADEYRYYYQLQVLEGLAIVAASIILVVCVEMPFKNMHSVIFERRRLEKSTSLINEQAKLKRKSKTG